MSENKSRSFSFLVPQEQAGISVNDFLLQNGFSKRLIVKLKQTEDGLAVNGERSRSTYRLNAGEALCITLPQKQVSRRKNEIAVPVLYEDVDIAAYDKPAGLACHRSGGHIDDTLENCFDGVFRAVYRLDKDTSGVLLTAKHQLAAARLHSGVDKIYLAVIEGEIEGDEGAIELPLERERAYEMRQTVSDTGKPCRTGYRVIDKSNGYSLVACTPHTGRMHQIRAHFAAIGMPLAGDSFYGARKSGMARQALHCLQASFNHPISGVALTVRAEIPTDMTAFLQEMNMKHSIW